MWVYFIFLQEKTVCVFVCIYIKYYLDLSLINGLLICRIKDIPELFIIGRPDMTIVAFGSDVVDIFEVNDILSSKGWHLNALQRPNR